jgi:hypothetical protein
MAADAITLLRLDKAMTPRKAEKRKADRARSEASQLPLEGIPATHLNLLPRFRHKETKEYVRAMPFKSNLAVWFLTGKGWYSIMEIEDFILDFRASNRTGRDLLLDTKKKLGLTDKEDGDGGQE